MGQMSGADVRVVDLVLSQIARGYKNLGFIGSALFPVVPVGSASGQIIEFGKEAFSRYATKVAPGANIPVVQFGYAGKKYALTDHALNGLVPFVHLRDAAVTPGLDLGAGAIASVQNIIALELEIEQAALALDPANYAGTNKVTLSGTSQWSDPASDPIADVNAGKSRIRKSIGRKPNLFEMSADVFDVLSVHPKLLDLFKHTSPSTLSTEQLASAFKVATVVVGEAIYLDAGTMVDVWGKDAVLAFTETGSLANSGAPTYGYTYRLSNYPLVESPWASRGNDSWLYPVRDSVSPVIAGADAGYLFTNAVA